METVIVEAVVSTAFRFLLDKLASSDVMKLGREGVVRKELEKWKNELLSIRQELDDPEEKQITREDVKKWLIDLRDLVYDMEDILDEFSYQAMGRDPSWFNRIHFVRNDKMMRKIRKITTRLLNSSARKGRLGLDKVAGGAGIYFLAKKNIVDSNLIESSDSIHFQVEF